MEGDRMGNVERGEERTREELSGEKERGRNRKECGGEERETGSPWRMVNTYTIHNTHKTPSKTRKTHRNKEINKTTSTVRAIRWMPRSCVYTVAERLIMGHFEFHVPQEP